MLDGQGVLVTRPIGQQEPLVSELAAAGATVLRLPVIDIVPRAESVIAAEAARLDTPDLSIFVSVNAVEFGIAQAAGRIAAIGPATAAAIEASGRQVDVRAETGYSSEDLLSVPALQRLSGKIVRIVRGSRGRELLAATLANRGAVVQYLGVYERRLPDYSAAELDRFETQWRAGEIDVIVAMSGESLSNLIQLLPSGCLHDFNAMRLVTPARRLLHEIEARYPGADVTLATGPGAAAITAAVVESLQPPRDLQRDAQR